MAVATSNLPSTSTISDVVGNLLTEGVSTTVRIPVASLAAQMLADGPIATAVAAVEAGMIVATSVADLDLDHPAKTGAWVIGAAGGIYRKLGAAGAGSWERIGDLPGSLVRAADVGNGTANAIQVTTQGGVTVGAWISFTAFRANTGAVSVAIDGAAPRALVNVAGDPVIGAGAIPAGMPILAYVGTSTLRMLNDQMNAVAIAAKAPITHVGDVGAAHGVATQTVAGFMSPVDKVKFDGVAAGATANQTDAYLLDRSHHTGAQAIATVTGLQTALDGKAAAVHGHVVADVTGLQTALDAKLARSGDTMTGSLTISGNWSSLTLNTPDATSASSVVFRTANVNRWTFGGRDDFSIGQYTAAGAWIGNAMAVYGSNGNIVLNPTWGRLQLGPTALETFGISVAKGVAAVREAIKVGSGASVSTSSEPAVRMQVTAAPNVYNAGAADGNKGLTTTWSPMGRVDQYVVGAGAFDKIAGSVQEFFSYCPNGGEHVNAMWRTTATGPRVSSSATNGWAPKNTTGDLWTGWFLNSDGGYDSNGITVEVNNLCTWGVRGDTTTPISVPFPAGGMHFGMQFSMDWSTYHGTRAISIVPTTASAGRPFDVGYHTAVFISGFANAGIVLGKSIPYSNPQNIAASATSPVGIDFASDDTIKMRFRWGETPTIDVNGESDGLVFRRDASHFFLKLKKDDFSTQMASGNVTISNAGAIVAASYVKFGSYTVGTLPSASASGAGARANVTDATASAFGSIVAAGGSTLYPVYSDGSNWRIGG